METFKNSDILSKHFIYQQYLILSYKRLFILGKKAIIIDSLPFQFDQREYISFEDLREIRISEKKGTYREFSLRTEKKSISSVLNFLAYDRVSLISSLYRAYDFYIFENLSLSNHPDLKYFQEFFSIFIDNFNDNKTLEEIKILAFRTSILVKFKENIQENKELLKLDLISIDSSTPNHNNINNNESSSLIKTRPKIESFNENLWIEFCNISQIIKKPNGFVLKMKSSGINFNFSTFDPEKTEKIITHIQHKMQEFLDIKVEINEDDTVMSPKLSPKNDKIFEELLLQQYFMINAYKISHSNNHFKKIVIGFNEKSIVEISMEDKIVLNKWPYSCLFLVVRHEHDFSGLEIIDKDWLKTKYLLCSSKRDIIITNLMHLMQKEGYFLPNDFIHSTVPQLQHYIKGFPKDQVDVDYEGEMLKKITLAKNIDEIYLFLCEFNINATAYKLKDSDPKSFQYLYQTLNRVLNSTILRPEIASFMENYYSWIYYKNIRADLSNCEIENFESSELFRDKILTTLQESHRLFLENEDFFNNGQNPQLSVKNFVDIMLKIEEILKTITICSNASRFFRDIGDYKSDDFYEKSLSFVVGLNDSASELIAYLSTNLLLRTIQYFDADKKHESLNKSLLITKKPILLKKLVESLAYKTLFGSRNQEAKYSLSIQISLSLFESLFITRKESTSIEDQTLIYKILSSKIILTALSNLSRGESIAILYKTSVLFNHLLQISNKISYKELQSLFLNSTSLFLLHMFHGLSHLSHSQRKESVIFISNLLTENQSACSLLIRIIPKCLLSRISTTQSDISKWGSTHWGELFNILKQNFNTPTEQWNDNCRKELLLKLKKADEEFSKRRRDITEKEILLNNGDINIAENKFLSLKWNHEEFFIDYEALKPKYLIWKYYLSCLIRDKEEPIITIAISQPLRLWNELTYSFISSLNCLERDKILKTMVLLYRFHSHHIREINAIPYWVNLLRNEDYVKHKYMIIQLLYCSFTREEPSINKINIKKLLESDLVNVLFEILSGLHFSLDDPVENFANPTYNFVEGKFIKNHVSNSHEEKINIGLFILNILQMLLNRQKPLDELDREVYPNPFVKSICLQQLNLEIIVNALLIPSEEITKIVFKILKELYLDRVSYNHLLKVEGFFQIILSKISDKNMEDIMGLIMNLYTRISEDPEMPNYITVYLNFDFEPLDPQIIRECLEFFPFLKFFPKNLIFRLFDKGYEEFANIFYSDSFEEPNLIWNKNMREKVLSLINEDLQSFQESLIHYSETQNVYKIQNLPRFKSKIEGEIIHENIEKEVKCGPLFLRIWNMKTQKHFFIEEEMIDHFLLILGDNLNGLILRKNQKEFEETVNMDDLLILLHSHSKAIKRYEIHQYSCFEAIIQILHYFSTYYASNYLPNAQISMEHKDPLFIIKVIIHGLRLVYRAIRLSASGNLENFVSLKGIHAIFSVLKALVTKIFLRKKSPEHIYYYNNVNLNAKDLGSLCLAVKIARFILQKNKSTISELESSQLIDFCILLQKISKIPLFYFEFLKCRKKLKNIEIPKKQLVLEEQSFEENLFEDLKVNEEENEINNSSALELYEKKLFFLIGDVAFIWLNFSIDVRLLDPLIKAGIPWRCIEFSLLYEENFDIGSFDYERTQKINEICEDFVLVLRNITIYANEAFGLKNKSNDDNLLEKMIISTKHKSETLFSEIHRLNIQRKEVLTAYFEGLHSLLMKKSIQGLLEDYFEAISKPEEKDKRGIKKFLNILNKDLEEETFIWTQENREDLKEILKMEISLINENENKGTFVEKIKGYHYGNHLNELMIDGIFVRIFNKNQSKIQDVAEFLKKLFYEIYARVKSLDENKGFSHPNTNNKRILKGKVFDVKRIIEALKAVNNILKNVGLHTIVLERTNFDILVRLLEDCNKWFGEMRNFLITLQLEIYNILENIINNTQEILKIITNKKLMKVFFQQLKSNARNDNVVIEKLLKILWNLSLQNLFFKILDRFGFIFVFFEIVLKSEIISKSNRILAFKLLLKLQTDNEFQNQDMFSNCISLFPFEIKQIIKENMDVSDFIDSLDSSIETPYFIWQREMRQEILKIISHVNEVILNEINELKYDYISMENSDILIKEYETYLHKPEFPTLANEVKIRDIYLRNFNKYPTFDIKVNLAIFIEEISSPAHELFIAILNNIFQKTNSSDLQISKKEKKIIDRNNRKFLTLISALLLSIEQFIYNKTNPQTAFTTSSFILNNRDDSTVSIETQKPLENSKFLSEETLSNIIKWLDLLSLDFIPLTIKSTLLEIIFLISDLERGVMLLKSNEIVSKLMIFFKKYAHFDEKSPRTEKNLSFVEEILVFNLLLKMFFEDHKLLGEFIENDGITIALRIFEFGDLKKYLDDPILGIFSFGLKNIQFSDIFEEHLKKKDYFVIDDLKRMKTLDYNFKKLWRSFKNTETFNHDIEKTLEYYYERKFGNFLFPLISQMAYEAAPFPEPEIKKKLKEIRNFTNNTVSNFVKNEKMISEEPEEKQNI